MADVQLALRPLPQFSGPAYRPAVDHARLSSQYRRIWSVMSDGAWRTLREIEDATGAPSASVSAQLRHMRKAQFGANVVEKRPRTPGTWEYRLLPTLTGLELVERSAMR